MYNRFSDFYDELVFDIDYEKYANNIFEILNKYNVNKGNILEIGCGTGNLTQELSKNKDYNILAFDNSIEMLNHSFVKLSDKENVTIILQDMYKFDYKSFKHDAIITLLDVINYITDEAKLEKLFKNIYDGLNENGVFIFDLNSRYKLLEVLGNNQYIYERKNIFYTWENRLVGDKVNFYLNFFVKNKDGLYERVEEMQVEKYYSIEFIVEKLKTVGFREIDYIDEDGGVFKENNTQRILFSAKK
ncbi:class I SAM-dependent methyltransferase [Helcococcus ovis]|uniref:Class I SAM-dependent methyltransferase n=1 Tax=Helcococcus ovis TaxID=72026 RepID=A0A4R9C4K3_9FIRM|nr:class I SAM-dependent methyltransferase [Helcococcus ovis]TFF65626.1 class I SAM-dependent methyltransferase [Helcococcus ovis]TFF67508.1 class I SAM-dependent methyltransferase [Helcococcus ovis]TFF68055.1 class I SAM-dependent methyltransferase [Helcococcus ovis]WNZ01715.1 class I SAM-dependent methyltransferase [Helcococcus ovis]